MADAFFERNGDRYESSELTRGPWDPGSQHAGPPAALLGREVERLESDVPRQVGRITFEILRPVPIAPLRVEARVVRPGRSVELVEATLSDAGGEVLRASQRLAASRRRRRRARRADRRGRRRDRARRGLHAAPRARATGTRERARSATSSTPATSTGYHTAMDYRFVAGAFLEPGPATVWMRMRQPLVAGEQPSPLQRVLVAADSGNGVSATLDWARFLFINVDLSVHLNRMPAGEWVCLDAITIPEPTGIGISDTALYDERGPIGRAAQTLLVAARQ